MIWKRSFLMKQRFRIASALSALQSVLPTRHTSGVQVRDVNALLKQYNQMHKMMKKMKGGKGRKMMKAMQSKMGDMDGLPGLPNF